jgi:hypothetical protein
MDPNAKQHLDACQMFANESETTTVELLLCRYPKTCRVQRCKRQATLIARGMDRGGRPTRQWELCQQHADQIVNGKRAGEGKSCDENEREGKVANRCELTVNLGRHVKRMGGLVSDDASNPKGLG